MGKPKSGSKSKGGRGGGKLFIANIEELQLRDREISEAQEARARRRAEDGEDGAAAAEESEGEQEEESGQEKAAETVFGFQRKSRAEAAAAKKASVTAEEDEENEEEEEEPMGLLTGIAKPNPNRMKKQERNIKIKNLDDTAAPADPTAGLTRKEKEVLAAQKAKEDYQRRHMAGQTEEARQQLAQLAIVRARREAAAKKREAEGRKPGMSANGIDSDQDISNNNKTGAAESSDEEDSEDDSEEDVKGKGPAKAAAATLAAKKKAAALAPVETNGELPKLKAMDIKKMNGDALKEHLKARELSVQGQKKDLIKRLCDYEAARD